MLSTAKAILTVEPSWPQTVVYVDGLPKSRLRWFGVELWRLSVRTSKVVGVRHEEFVVSCAPRFQGSSRKNTGHL